MIWVLLNWIYVFITSYLVGSFAYRKLIVFVKYSKDRASVNKLFYEVMAGLALLTAYSQYFSLVSGVGLAANLLMVGICMLFLFLDSKEYTEEIKEWIENGRREKLKGILCLSAAFMISLFVSNGNFMYDTGLYHAQSIRWIEEYGAVKGIANIHERLGYNSAFFSLSALFSMKWLIGQSLHGVQGFGALFAVSYSLVTIYDNLRKRRAVLCPSTICSLGPFIYTAIIFQELISPTTDYMTVYFIMWLVTAWVRLIEEGEREIFPYAYLCIVIVFLITLKLSAALLILAVLWPAIRLIKEKRWKEIAVYIVSGCFLLLPYLWRNYIVSGWLLYPFSSIDLFSVDWKLAKGTVDGDAMDVKLWARYIYDRELIDETIFQWFPTWWREQGDFNRNFSLGVFGMLILGMLTDISFWLFSRTIVKTKKWIQYAYLKAVLIVCFFFWLLSAPMHRYGFAFIIMVSLLMVGVLFDMMQSKIQRLWPFALSLFLGVFMAKSLFPIGKEALFMVRENLRDNSYWVRQKDYPNPEMDSAKLGEITIYYPKDPGGQSWYYSFPATNFGENIQYWKPRGEGIEDGFCQKRKDE